MTNQRKYTCDPEEKGGTGGTSVLGLGSEIQRLANENERLSQENTRLNAILEAQSELVHLREENKRLQESEGWKAEISQLSAEVRRLKGEVPRNARIGGACFVDLNQLSNEHVIILREDIRRMRQTVLEHPYTDLGDWIYTYLPRAMRDALSRCGVEYRDGVGDNDWYGPWFHVYQNRALSDDERLLGLRDSRRGVPARIDHGSMDVIVACETLVELSVWLGIKTEGRVGYRTS